MYNASVIAKLELEVEVKVTGIRHVSGIYMTWTLKITSNAPSQLEGKVRVEMNVKLKDTVQVKLNMWLQVEAAVKVSMNVNVGEVGCCWVRWIAVMCGGLNLMR